MTFKQATTAAIILAVTIAMTSILGVANAHNHEGEKPAMTGINVAALTLPEIIRGLDAGQLNSQDLTRAYLNRLMKIETIWVFTIIETKGWDHRSQEADALEQRMEKRMNIAMNATAVCLILIPITVLALVLRLVGLWG